MVLKCSYIFLDHPNKEPSSYEDENGTLTFVLGRNVYSFIKKEFPTAQKSDAREDVFQTKLECIMNEGKLSVPLSFVITDVEQITYLDVIVKGSCHSNLITCLESVQDKLFNSGVRKYYIDIVSYDAISEYYCNKAFVKLNALERNLRKLLFNIYILHFGKDYYSATMVSDLQDKIKGIIGSSNSKDYQRGIKERYDVSTDLAKEIVRLQQFFYSLEFGDISELLFSSTWTTIDEEKQRAFLDTNRDLSMLSDEELRNAFKTFTPKSDWDRFFSRKIKIMDAQKLIDEIRRYRNAVAHLKFLYKEDYNKSVKLMLKLNKAILKAIELTEEKDFAEKNAESISKALSVLSDTIARLTEIVGKSTMSSSKNKDGIQSN